MLHELDVLWWWVVSESPMVLDTSMVDVERQREQTAEERLNSILTVPEYTDDIYKYLRQLEVIILPI